jgi:hypothetical protein
MASSIYVSLVADSVFLPTNVTSLFAPVFHYIGMIKKHGSTKVHLSITVS